MRRALPRPVHLRRAGHRLAGQQQHRRVDLRAAGPGAAPGARVGRRRRRAPAAPARRSAATSATGGCPPGWPSSTRRARRSSPAGGTATRRRRPGAPRGSRASAGRGSSPRFVPTIVDRMICVPDAASLAAMRELERVTGRRAGGSTGTNLWGAFQLVAEMVAAGRQRQRRHAAVRRRRAVRPHLLLRRVAGGAGPGPRPARRHAAAVRRRRGSGPRRDGDRRHRPRARGSPLPASNIHDRSQAGPRARVLNRR